MGWIWAQWHTPAIPASSGPASATLDLVSKEKKRKKLQPGVESWSNVASTWLSVSGNLSPEQLQTVYGLLQRACLKRPLLPKSGQHIVRLARRDNGTEPQFSAVLVRVSPSSPDIKAPPHCGIEAPTYLSSYLSQMIQ